MKVILFTIVFAVLTLLGIGLSGLKKSEPMNVGGAENMIILPVYNKYWDAQDKTDYRTYVDQVIADHGIMASDVTCVDFYGDGYAKASADDKARFIPQGKECTLTGTNKVEAITFEEVEAKMRTARNQRQ